jgi:hypothetical protein
VDIWTILLRTCPVSMDILCAHAYKKQSRMLYGKPVLDHFSSMPL